MLCFPKVVYIDQRTLDNGQQYKVYKLDWTDLRQLPEPYNTEVDNLLFGITDDYLTEINRNQARAIEEWDYRRSFDTCIRDMCLEPAIAHVKVFFKLLFDCAYNYQEDSWWLTNAMIYRMWMGQTGSMCAVRNAELDVLREAATSDSSRYHNHSKRPFLREGEHTPILKFVEALEQHRVEASNYKFLRKHETYTSPFTGQKL